MIKDIIRDGSKSRLIKVTPVSVVVIEESNITEDIMIKSVVGIPLSVSQRNEVVVLTDEVASVEIVHEELVQEVRPGKVAVEAVHLGHADRNFVDAHVVIQLAVANVLGSVALSPSSLSAPARSLSTSMFSSLMSR